MSNVEALEYVDLVVETLHQWGIIPEHNYGNMTADQREELADKVQQKSEE